MIWYVGLILAGTVSLVIAGIVLVTGIRIMRQMDEIAHGPRRRRQR